jgi:uncharacterized protein
VPPTPDARRLPFAILTLVAWTLATFLGGGLLRSWADGPRQEAVLAGLGWNYVAAIAVLALASFILRWQDLRFVPPKPPRSVWILWFPALTLALFAALAHLVGLPSAAIVRLLAVNTILIALSEEWMFRGILFQALRTRFTLWATILVSSLTFGLVHLLNALATGDFPAALVQAVAATMSGMLFAAILIRTGSIWPAVVYHALWNFGILMTTAVSEGPVLPNGPISPSTYGVTVILVLPNFLYAFYLLRRVRNDTLLTTD